MQRVHAEAELRAAVEAVASARLAMALAVHHAREAGMSFREIADLVGFSHETVRRISLEPLPPAP